LGPDFVNRLDCLLLAFGVASVKLAIGGTVAASLLECGAEIALWANTPKAVTDLTSYPRGFFSECRDDDWR
jgi:hypothetical protein